MVYIKKIKLYQQRKIVQFTIKYLNKYVYKGHVRAIIEYQSSDHTDKPRQHRSTFATKYLKKFRAKVITNL